jgi:hypothetical protein
MCDRHRRCIDQLPVGVDKMKNSFSCEVIANIKHAKIVVYSSKDEEIS